MSSAPFILVVDDDEDVRRTMSRSLERYSLRTVAVPDGAAALALIEQRDAVALLLSDVHLADTNGYVLAAEARRRRPGLPVLLVSGTEPRPSLADAGIGPTQFLAKPFIGVQLLDAIRQLLGGDDAMLRVDTPGPSPRPTRRAG